MWHWLHQLASPPTFNRFADKVIPWGLSLWLLTFVIGLVWSLWIAPTDYQQGEAYRIIFVHVPAAWLSLFVYTSMTIIGTIGLIWHFKLSDIYIRCAAPLGALFTFLTLITGSVWGKPMWGTWWAWDARLTSELILLFIYIGFIALQSSFTDQQTRRQVNAIVLLIGFVNIPIIHFSVEWWTSLHQPASILKFGAPSVHPDMLKPLLLMAFSYTLFFSLMVIMAMQNKLTLEKQNQYYG